MCGICGIVNFNASEPVNAQLVECMNDAQAHRGPDDQGVYLQKGVGFGFRRLSIIDTSLAGHQPMSSDDGQLTIVFNGEIYNYKALRHNLQKRGHTFRTQTDTEVIVHAYEEDGIDCVKHFNGIFAFALGHALRAILGGRDREHRREQRAASRAALRTLFGMSPPPFGGPGA